MLSTLLWEIRLPRILLSIFIGAGLATAGALTQGIFQNALASPSVLGLQGGAAIAVMLGIILRLDETALWALPLLSALGVLLTVLILFLLSFQMKGFTPLLLSGIALSTFLGAIIQFLNSLFIWNYTFNIKFGRWLLGSFDAKNWDHVLLAGSIILCALLGAFFIRRGLDVLHLGVQTASSLGLSLRGTYCIALVSIALLIGASTATIGLLGFVGLLVPHCTRLLIGVTYKKIIVFTPLFGAIFVLLVDTISRFISHFYLAPGAITSLLGAPFFLWLIRKYFLIKKLY